MLLINIRRLRLYLFMLLLVVAAVYLLQAKWFWRIFYPWPYKQEIVRAAVNTGIDPCLLVAVVKVESGFNPRARSDAGALGLMQLMPGTAGWVARQTGWQDFHTELLYQPEINLMIGSWYLKHLLQDFDGNLIAGLAAYNAGRGNVEAWVRSGLWKGTKDDLDKIPFPETRAYVRAVLQNYEIYRYLYD
ncbi:lytic transglycosylase [Thermacetogenium phaeum DSM 12270]|jgi:soluble lytic murein transglycosylase|uniref:Lytic transglycosylase n=1 Tax=Thermacetogenium phaeum (strain ATCC BAA-254 / DSM 26808 / PB) TaxID=1089553 RepID=K4LJ63_THEPS|nr:lytic transglycosylase domain-containing protein [Thermacetogenium phaeum]AFV12005.1 lytic transglycosylase [Thermacetogenium phaeum DSM 12270]